MWFLSVDATNKRRKNATKTVNLINFPIKIHWIFNWDIWGVELLQQLCSTWCQLLHNQMQSVIGEDAFYVLDSSTCCMLCEQMWSILMMHCVDWHTIVTDTSVFNQKTSFNHFIVCYCMCKRKMKIFISCWPLSTFPITNFPSSEKAI